MSDTPFEEWLRAERDRLRELALEVLARCHLGLGELGRRTGDARRAGDHITVAAAMFREMDMQFWLEKAEAART